MTMDNVDLEAMSRNDLVHYMVAHRGEPGEIEARRIYIRRFAEKAKACGIDFYRQNERAESSIEPNV
jgi:hypothetical protein